VLALNLYVSLPSNLRYSLVGVAKPLTLYNVGTMFG